MVRPGHSFRDQQNREECRQKCFQQKMDFFMVGDLFNNNHPQAKLFCRVEEVKFFFCSVPRKQKNMNFLHEI
jgi:hypothetical protein